ncbi:hypothetical protein WA577_001530, partial [Blastocystis sp. JDR]
MLDVMFMPCLFLLSGIFDTLCTQQLVYQGASNMRSMFSIFAYYFSQAIVGFSCIEFGDAGKKKPVLPDIEEAHSLVKDEDSRRASEEYELDIDKAMKRYEKKLRLLYVVSALLDIMGYVIRTIGMVYCGSGLFQVAFSSVAIFSAVYSRIFLKTNVSAIQWLGIAIVTSGLIVSPLSSNSQGKSPVTGILLTLLGAQFYSISYIVNEAITRIPGNKGTKEICKQVGVINTMICCVVILIDTIPNRAKLIYEPIARTHTNLSSVFVATFVYVISHIIHSYALYSVQGALGAIWTGLLQCIRACVVFFTSGYLYCASDPNQCITWSKIVATILVTCGIAIFTYGKRQNTAESAETSDE